MKNEVIAAWLIGKEPEQKMRGIEIDGQGERERERERERWRARKRGRSRDHITGKEVQRKTEEKRKL